MRRMPLNAEELENFLFLSEDFNFQNEEMIENASQDKLYFKIVNEIIKRSKTTTNAPLIIFDKYNANIYVGSVNNDSTAYATYTTSYANSILEFDYHGDTDILNIHLHDEIYVTADNIKTIFGQDITGTGNITLYRHELIISTGRTSYDETEYKAYVTYYSINNLEANTPEKLTTLTKANSSTILRGIVLEFANAGVINATISGKYSGVNYLGDQSGWALEKAIGGSDGTAIKSVSDIVTPIQL